jgi:hypothetical protein
MKFLAMIFTVGLVFGTATLGQAEISADLNTQATTMNTLATSQGEGKVTGKISSDFNSFLGSDANAVVTGLRNGTPIKLTSTTTTPSTTPGGLPVTTTTTTTITPPTGQMGFGNVYISLALAKQQLSTLGITQPTAQQLQAALTGGSITQTIGTGTTATTTTTNLQGILTMRSQNMGWGKIAQQLNFKLGPVMSSMKSANHSLASAQQTSTTKSNVVSAAGQTSGRSGDAIVSASGKGAGNGIVSASGNGGNGQAYGRSSGIVTGSGHGSSAGVSSAGGGNGAGHGNGHGK